MPHVEKLFSFSKGNASKNIFFHKENVGETWIAGDYLPNLFHVPDKSIVRNVTLCSITQY